MDVEILVEEVEVAVEFLLWIGSAVLVVPTLREGFFLKKNSCVYQFVSNTNQYVLCCEKVNQ